MGRVRVITDTNSGLTQKQAAKLGVMVVPMPCLIHDKVYYEDRDITREEFFRQLEGGEHISTSQPSPADVINTFEAALEEADEAVYIPMSSGLSGSCQSAMVLAEDYDDRIQVVNNRRVSVTQKSSVLDALAMAENGMDAVSIRKELERRSAESSIYIMPDTLEYLKRGGRITPAAAAIGTLLRIRPVLQIKGERLDAFAKARTAAHGRAAMLTAMKKDIEELRSCEKSAGIRLYAVHGNIPGLQKEWVRQVREAFPGFEVEEDQLPLSICCHTGPVALAVACTVIPEIS